MILRVFSRFRITLVEDILVITGIISIYLLALAANLTPGETTNSVKHRGIGKEEIKLLLKTKSVDAKGNF